MGEDVWVVVVHLRHPASCSGRRMGNRRHRSATKRSAPRESSFGAVEGNFKSTLTINCAAVEMKSDALQLTWTAARPKSNDSGQDHCSWAPTCVDGELASSAPAGSASSTSEDKCT